MSWVCNELGAMLGNRSRFRHLRKWTKMSGGGGGADGADGAAGGGWYVL